jgi:effector-binding domain-containing protein
MTAPVTQQASGEVWKVRFVMPASFTLETLPRPNDERVKLIALPSKRFAVIRFSGSQGDKNMKSHQENLLAYISEHKLPTTGEPILAFYNPPWTLPFFKRNEVMLELQGGPGTSSP